MMAGLSTQLTEPRGHGMVPLVPESTTCLSNKLQVLFQACASHWGMTTKRSDPASVVRLCLCGQTLPLWMVCEMPGRQAAAKLNKHTANRKQLLSSSCVPGPGFRIYYLI